MLQIDNLKVRYGDFLAVDIDEEISFSGRNRIGVIGSNGAGKSTLIKAILEMVPYEGSIFTGLKKDEIQVQLQHNSYSNNVSVRRIMELILDSKLEENKEAWELIEFFEFEKCLKKKFNQLSGGEKQKLTLILVLSKDSKLLILDEVTSGLDYKSRESLMDMLEEWFENKVGDRDVIIVSHYYKEIERIAESLIIMDSGRVLAWGNTRELFRKYCGEKVYKLKNTDKGREISKGYRVLYESLDNIVIGINDRSTEASLVELLLKYDLDFERSSLDIEVLTSEVKRRCKYE